MNDNLSASFILMAGAGLLAYWFYHLTGEQRRQLLAKARATGDLPAEMAHAMKQSGGFGPLPGVGTPNGPPTPFTQEDYDRAARQGGSYFPQQRGGY